MSYIAFLDLVGTKDAASISSQRYNEKIKTFSDCLKTIGDQFDCSIYGYSDNAYLQIENLHDMLNIFRIMRERLRRFHIYFSAAIDRGTLDAQSLCFKTAKGNIMVFRNASTSEIYSCQSNFNGIGCSFSPGVIDDLKREDLTEEITKSAYEPDPNDVSYAKLVSVCDLSYKQIGHIQLEHIINDYLQVITLNSRAARYYITPIISMIKSYDLIRFEKELSVLVQLISFQTVPKSFLVDAIAPHRMLFMFSLIEHLFSIDSNMFEKTIFELCRKVVQESNIPMDIYVRDLPRVPNMILSRINKEFFIKAMYDYSGLK